MGTSETTFLQLKKLKSLLYENLLVLMVSRQRVVIGGFNIVNEFRLL